MVPIAWMILGMFSFWIGVYLGCRFRTIESELFMLRRVVEDIKFRVPHEPNIDEKLETRWADELHYARRQRQLMRTRFSRIEAEIRSINRNKKREDLLERQAAEKLRAVLQEEKAKRL